MSWFSSKKKPEAKTEDASRAKPKEEKKKENTNKGWLNIDLSNAFDDEEETNNTTQQQTNTETQDNINPIMTQPPIDVRIKNATNSGDNNTNNDNKASDTSTDMEEDGLDQLDSVDTNTEDSVSDVFKDEETEEEPKETKETKKILKRDDEEKTKEYIKQTLGRIINGENLLENMQTFMDFIRIIPDNDYEENIDNYAIVLANATINGEKIFKDTEDAKQFINKVRNGTKTSTRYIKPRAQKQIKQEMQKQMEISPMMLRNVKARTQAINVFQY